MFLTEKKEDRNKILLRIRILDFYQFGFDRMPICVTFVHFALSFSYVFFLDIHYVKGYKKK